MRPRSSPPDPFLPARGSVPGTHQVLFEGKSCRDEQVSLAHPGSDVWEINNVGLLDDTIEPSPPGDHISLGEGIEFLQGRSERQRHCTGALYSLAPECNPLACQRSGLTCERIGATLSNVSYLRKTELTEPVVPLWSVVDPRWPRRSRPTPLCSRRIACNFRLPGGAWDEICRSLESNNTQEGD